jgi:DNA-binding NarL/FixJ family response regulator
LIKVLIADDHAIVRKGLKQILADTTDTVAVGEATTEQELFDMVRSIEDLNVVVLDLSMPGRGGLETLKQLKLEYPKLPVLILTIYPEDQYAIRVLKAGASGYLTKESAPDQLVTAIRKVARGEKYIGPRLAERLAADLGRDFDRPLHEALSDREFQVMRMIAKGKTITEIADELSLSVKTISTYRARVLEKMKIKNNAEMTHYAIEQHLID